MKRHIHNLVIAAALLGAAGSGCTVGHFRSTGPDGRISTVTSYTVAYPWMDTAANVGKASVTSKTNATSVSLTGVSETGTINTNALTSLGEILGTALGTAVKIAAKP